jgi:hypothetical protein
MAPTKRGEKAVEPTPKGQDSGPGLARELHILGYASVNLNLALSACDFLLSGSLQPQDAVSRCLLAGVVVLYGQLFKRSGGVGRLGQAEELVPAASHEIHHQVILMRDKIIAHRDLDGVYTKYGRANQLYLLRTPEAYGWAAPDSIGMDKELLADVRNLIRDVLKRVDWQIEKRERALEGVIRRLSPGQYRLVLDMDPVSVEQLQDHELFDEMNIPLTRFP